LPAFFLAGARAPPAHAAQCAIPPAHTATPFFLHQTLTGGAQPSGFPYLQPAGQPRPPSWPPAVTGRFPRSPAFNPVLQAAVKPALHFPAINRQFPLLKPPS
jgi:hypothetical protein